MVDLPIPGNDDSIRSIRMILTHLGDAIASGKASIPKKADEPSKADEPKAIPSIR